MSNETFSKDTRVAIYCRVSTDDQSCERQERDLQALALRAGYQVVAVFKETASGTVNDRRLRADVITLARQRKINAVLVTELTRWGRSTVDLINTVQELGAYNVSLLALNGRQFDCTTPDGKLMLTIFAGLSEFERDILGERTKSGMKATAARGTKLGRPQGNRTDKKHSKAIVTLHQQGFSYRDIAHKLKIGKDTVGRVIKAATEK